MSYGYDVFQICDSNQSHAALNLGKYELVAGFGNMSDSIRSIDELCDNKNSIWRFGLIQYPDYSKDVLGELFFFTPKLILFIKTDEKTLHLIAQSQDINLPDIANHLNNITPILSLSVEPKAEPVFSSNTSIEAYIDKVNTIRNDILNGKYYEMNYCVEFKAKWEGEPLLPYMLRLNERSSAPFSIYAKLDRLEILCSSPERFLSLDNGQLISQPIKGTNALMHGQENETQLHKLKTSEKERAENVMIVDLVRNDLSKVCLPGSIKVDELFGTYAFKTLNHMISTVSGSLSPENDFKQIIKSLFPMGSMTGAPKIEVMKHIELYEDMKRGVYSGCMGYIEPNGSFDFNVMIRTLVCDRKDNTISFKVGSAITYDSMPEHEYEECLLKGQRLESLFRN